jgi:hypothetical protein
MISREQSAMRKVVAFDGRGAISVIEQPIPQPGPGEILLGYEPP